MPQKPPPDSVEETDPEMVAFERQYTRWYNSLSTAEKIAYGRKTSLGTLLKWRGLMAKYPDRAPPEFYRARLRTSQIRLLELRAWRATGIEPGNA